MLFSASDHLPGAACLVSWISHGFAAERKTELRRVLSAHGIMEPAWIGAMSMWFETSYSHFGNIPLCTRYLWESIAFLLMISRKRCSIKPLCWLQDSLSWETKSEREDSMILGDMDRSENTKWYWKEFVFHARRDAPILALMHRQNTLKNIAIQILINKALFRAGFYVSQKTTIIFLIEVRWLLQWRSWRTANEMHCDAVCTADRKW